MSKVLAIDYGTKRLGLALSDERQRLAFAYLTLPNLDLEKQLLPQLKEICDKEDVATIVIGLPLNLSGEQTQTTQLVFDFIRHLKSSK